MPNKLPIIQSNPQSIPLMQLKLEDFSGGMVTSQPSGALSLNQFTNLYNVYMTEQGHLEGRNPFRPLFTDLTTTDTALTAAPFPSFFYHQALGMWMACINDPTDAGDMRWFEFNTTSKAWANAYATLQTGTFTFGECPEVVRYSVGNATDYLIFDPKTTGAVAYRMTKTGDMTAMGLTAPSAPASVTDAAKGDYSGGIDKNGTYYYRVAYVYDDGANSTTYGESAASASTSVDVDTVTATKAAVVTVTLAATPGSTVSQVHVYRSPNGQIDGPFMMVGNIYKPGGGWSGTVTFLDNTPVGEEGEEEQEFAASMVEIKHPVVADGRLWGFDRDIPNKLVYSDAGQPDVFEALSYFYLPEDGTGLALFNRNLYAFTSNACYVLPNADPETTTELLKVSDQGCISHKSIVDVKIGLCWIGRDSVYFANFNDQSELGDFAIPIGEPIEDQIRGIPSARRSAVVATCWRERYYVSFTDKLLQSATYNTKTFVWDVRTGARNMSQGRHGAWTRLSWTADAFYQNDGYLYTLCLQQAYRLGVAKGYYIYQHGFATDTVLKDYGFYTTDPSGDGKTIESVVRTGIYHLSSPVSKKKPHAIVITGESAGVTLTADFEMNEGEYKTSATLTIGNSSVDAINSTYGVWDAFTWDYAGISGATPPIGDSLPSFTAAVTDTTKTRLTFATPHSLSPSAGSKIKLTGVTNSVTPATATTWNHADGVAYTYVDTTEIDVTTPAYDADTDFTLATAIVKTVGVQLTTARLWATTPVMGQYDRARCNPNTKGNDMTLSLWTNDMADTRIDSIVIFIRELPFTI